MDWIKFGMDLKKAREELTLKDLTDSQWARVCNRIANCIHQQIPPGVFDWDGFMEACGLSKDREVC